MPQFSRTAALRPPGGWVRLAPTLLNSYPAVQGTAILRCELPTSHHMEVDSKALTVLIVEDEAISRAALSTLLSSNGYRTESVGTAEEALELLHGDDHVRQHGGQHHAAPSQGAESQTAQSHLVALV